MDFLLAHHGDPVRCITGGQATVSKKGIDLYGRERKSTYRGFGCPGPMVVEVHVIKLSELDRFSSDRNEILL
jgi:hypothetical protein